MSEEAKLIKISLILLDKYVSYKTIKSELCRGIFLGLYKNSHDSYCVLIRNPRELFLTKIHFSRCRDFMEMYNNDATPPF